jgi:hypothetical protein
MKVKLLNDILPWETNMKILEGLATHHWFIAYDNIKNPLKKIISNSNSGFSVITYHEDRPEWNSYLNEYGFLIFEKIKNKLKLKKVKINRFYWNMYFKNSTTEEHTDMKEKDYTTIVYNLHTTDGGTIVDGKFYKDVISQAKVFKSNLVHRGVSPKKDNVRFNLNIIYRNVK